MVKGTEKSVEENKPHKRSFVIFSVIKICRTKETMPLDRAGLFSFITYSWLTKYMKRAYKQGLKRDDIPLCSTKDSCDNAAQRYSV